ncbi:hypothetical protein [Corynebacterium vitaeruminis]|mgnify:CR=1 FL=1|uniref:TetR family transcriptional regulator n=1 Tax=Corynebacterium vitaeruminis DSM 20294 TaxID=1224164 RepID=W5XXL3_9CORY|nr:hypothetical protein [Corynebacterium vitaeruminis]AHI21410.1 hypothetical protein B843_00070 [Corynebacterium vitaeruminis DSM 20294]
MSAPPRGLSPEQVLAIADAFAERFPCEVVDYSALCAIAGASSPRFDGFPVFETPEPLAAHLSSIITRLKPLSAHNDEFATIVARVLLGLNAY